MSSCVFEDDNKENDNESNNIDYSTSKSLKRAQQYFDSGHVIDMEDSLSVTSNIYCVKFLVQTSFKSVKYPVQVMVHGDTGKIILGTCECKASTLGRCSHVAALLYALKDFVKKFGRNNIPCTRKLCTWNQGQKSKEPVVVGERQYSEKRVQKTKKDFDPRRPDTVILLPYFHMVP